jgi:hypothetical protein
VFKKKSLGMVVHTYNASTWGTWEAEAGDFRVGGQLGLHETLSQKKKKKIQRWRGSLDHDKFLTSHSGKSIYAM